MLVEAGADVAAASQDGWTPLRRAEDGRHGPAAEVLRAAATRPSPAAVP
jgi:hypothetical protein